MGHAARDHPGADGCPPRWLAGRTRPRRLRGRLPGGCQDQPAGDPRLPCPARSLDSDGPSGGGGPHRPPAGGRRPRRGDARGAHRRDSPRLALLVTTSAALAAPAGQAGHLFEQTLGIRGADRCPFEFARVQLAFGEHLGRTRAPSDARVHLGAALAAFRALGARPWADRAANELRAARLTLTKTEYHRIPALTAQEHQIVSLAAAGLTNKQIGQRLYLSPAPLAPTSTRSSRN